MRFLLDLVVYALVRTFFGVIRVLPRALGYPLCRGLAAIVFRLDARHRRIGLVNLEIAFPDKSLDWRRKTLKRSFQRLGEMAVELSRLSSVSPSDVARRVSYEEGRGLENYLAAREAASGRGILFVTAHFGAWEFLPVAHAVLGHPLSFIVRPLDNRFLEKWVARLRSRFGNRTLSKHQAMRGVLSELEAGRDVGFLIDQNVQENEGVYVPLFGRPASTSSAVATLALRKRLPMVAGFLYPDSPAGHYRIRFYPPFEAHPSDDEGEAIRQATARLNSLIEEMIREFPDCWLWGHRRFNTQPEGESPYDR